MKGNYSYAMECIFAFKYFFFVQIIALCFIFVVLQAWELVIWTTKFAENNGAYKVLCYNCFSGHLPFPTSPSSLIHI